MQNHVHYLAALPSADTSGIPSVAIPVPGIPANRGASASVWLRVGSTGAEFTAIKFLSSTGGTMCVRVRLLRDADGLNEGVGAAKRSVWRFAVESVASTRAKSNVIQAAARRYEPAGLCSVWRNICVAVWHEYFRSPQLRLWLDGQLICSAQIPEPTGDIV